MNTHTETHTITGLAPEEIAKEVREHTAYALRGKEKLTYPDPAVVYTTTGFTGLKATLLVIDHKEMAAEVEARRQGNDQWKVQVTVAKEGGFAYSPEPARITMHLTWERPTPPSLFFIKVIDTIQ